jgi:hypothetical protein
MRTVTLGYIALLLLATPLLAQPVPDPAKVDHTTGTFHGCPAIGDAKLTVDPNDTHQADPYLNALKNRDKAPASFTNTTVAAVVVDKPAAGKGRRDTWTQKQRDAVAPQEKTALAVVGFLASVKQECPESCNCHDHTRVDFHMWLVDDKKDANSQGRAHSMVVELSPRLLDAHPTWPALANAAFKKKVLVRISGWRTWDQEHPDQLGGTRATLWEIHPILRIEVKGANGTWVPIETSSLKPDSDIFAGKCK